MTFLIMAACMYPVLLILYGVMRYYGRPRAGLLFGARVGPELEGEAALGEITRRFRRRVTLWLLVLAVIPLVTLPIPYMSIAVTFWMLWCFVAIFALQVPFAQANRAVRAWKAEHGYAGTGESRRLVETRDLGEMRGLPWPVPAAATLVSLGAAAFAVAGARSAADALTVGLVAFTFALITPLLGGCGLWMERQRQKVISADSQVNLNYNRARRALWRKYWMFCLLVNTALTLAYSVTVGVDFELGMVSLLWGTIAYVAALLAATGVLMHRLGRLDQRYRDRMDLAAAEDDDDCWLWGMFYYNPNDRKATVEKRIGVGTTVNLATPAGKGLMIFVAVVLLGVLLVCVWTIRLEFTPIRLTVQGDTLVAEQLREDYAIPLEDIQEVALVEELPDMTRANGTAMDNLSKGDYRLRESGEHCQVFLNPQNTVFLSLLAGGQRYYLSAATDQETLALYASLTQA